MRSPLRECPSCQRHVRIRDAACPFCDTALPASFHTPPALGNPAGRLALAAMVGAAATVAACSDSSQPSDAGVINAADAYGVPFDGTPGPYDASDSGDASDARPDNINAADAYGVPFDSGND
jgi:hypothetical protein